MNSQTMTEPNTAMFVTLALNAWETHNKRVDQLIEKLTDEQINGTTAPDRNTGTYLLGHLTAVSDGILPLLGLGERMYPEMENAFVKNPDNADVAKPSLAEIKTAWSAVNAKLRAGFAAMEPEEWFGKHTVVSEEDFAKEPTRNKMNILIGRTNHQAYHMGQMAYLNK